MKGRISNTHNSHGSVFTLSLTATSGDKNDNSVIEFLKGQLKDLDKEPEKIERTFYIRKASPIEGGLAITLSENPVLMARVDYYYNHSRSDLKFPVLLLDERASEHDSAKHFICHWCKKEVWGVQREAIEVYIPEKREVNTVQVHRECQEIRNRQVAKIPFVITK